MNLSFFWLRQTLRWCLGSLLRLTLVSSLLSAAPALALADPGCLATPAPIGLDGHVVIELYQ
mgnify:CR=1 FL=1